MKKIKEDLKTRAEWLTLLPEFLYRKWEQAIEENIAFWNKSRSNPLNKEHLLKAKIKKENVLKDSCLTGGFKFSQTKEGFRFWDNVDKKYFQ